MPDFSILSTPNFAQAALGGFQAGQAIRQSREREAALKGYADNPDDETAIGRLVVADPSLGVPLQERRARAAQQAQIGSLAMRAAEGDHDAAVELWGLDPDLASKFDDRTQGMVKQGTEAIGNAAYRIYLETPEEGIPAAADAAIDALAQNFPNLARYKGQVRTRGDLEAILDQTGMSKAALEAKQPRYQPIVPGGRIENTNPLSESFVGNTISRGGDPSASNETALRAQAEEAIRNGADPAAVNRRLSEMLGGASPTGSRTFP